MPDPGTGYVDTPLLYTSTGSTTGGTEGITFTWPIMQEYIFQKDRAWNAWGSTGTSVTCNHDTIPISWLDTNATSASSITLSSQLTTAANHIWGLESWQETKHSNARWTPTIYRTIPEPVKTPEEIAAAAARQELQRQERVRQRAKQDRFKDASQQRARNLLLSMLTPEQQTELDEKNHFHLTVHDRDGSHRVYRIEHGYAGNVKLLDASGRPTKRYCIHADYRLPKEDQMLAQKLLLESNEKDFLRIANMSRCAA